MLEISFFESELDNLPQRVTAGSLREIATPRAPRATKEGTAWSPALYDEGATRSVANVKKLTCLVFDLDTELTSELEEKLGKYRGVAHSTFTEGRWRVILELERECAPDAYERVWLRIHREMGSPFDEACKDVSRLYYLPGVPEGRATEVVEFEGVPVPLEAPEAPSAPPAPAPKAEKVYDKQELVARTKVVKDAEKRAELKSFVEGDWAPKPGERNVSIHRMMSLAANTLAIPLDDAKYLIDRMLEKLDCEPEGREHWRGVACSSYERGLEYRKQQQELEEATLQVARSIRAPEPDLSTGDWKKALQTKTDGDGAVVYLSTGWNLYLILKHDSRFSGLRFNVVSQALETGTGPLRGVNMNHLDTALSNWLAISEYRLRIGREVCQAQLALVASEQRYDPVKEYLEALKWDGTPRITTALAEHCNVGNPNRAYVDAVSRRWFIAAATRGLNPGAQVDSILLLVGKGGQGKTTLARVLGGDWYGELTGDVTAKDSLQYLAGSWIVELGEMASARRSETEQMRSFLTRRVDKFRPPYGRVLEEFPRRAVFVGTTNYDTPISDHEGIRRYWPVRVEGPIEGSWLRDNRDQLWAEAAHYAKAGERYWFNLEENEMVAEEAALFETNEHLVDMVIAHIQSIPRHKRPSSISSLDLLTGMGFTLDNVRSSQVQLGHTLQRLGFTRRRVMRGKIRTYMYDLPANLLEDSPSLAVVPREDNDVDSDAR